MYGMVWVEYGRVEVLRRLKNLLNAHRTDHSGDGMKERGAEKGHSNVPPYVKGNDLS